MKVELAKNSGFCFGVKRAVEILENLQNQGKKVCTFGPIIHNPSVIEKFLSSGGKIVENLNQFPKGSLLVIRSHGVPRKIFEQIKEKDIEFIDATCPFVKTIHTIVQESSENKNIVLIAGSLGHPEITGIIGNICGKYFVFETLQDLEKIIDENRLLLENSAITVVAQTTFSLEKWKECSSLIKEKFEKARIFETICNATAKRQQEASRLSKNVDLMVVLGGKESSNTEKLRAVCSQNTQTYKIESIKDLPQIDFKDIKLIGITAGASTPGYIIKEAVEFMQDIVNEDFLGEEDFETMLEESLSNLSTDSRVKGLVVGIAPNEVYVDIGRKQAGFIPVSELSYEKDIRPEDIINIGDELDLLIMKTNDQDGTIMLSKKRVDSLKGWDEIVKASETGEILSGKISEIIKGGAIAIVKGLKVFIPASLTAIPRGESLDELKNQEVNMKIIEVNESRRRAVGSIKAVIQDQTKELREKFWQTAQVGSTYQGKVKSLTSYGAFVDLGGIDGMIHISELSWSKIKHPSEVVKVGDIVEVTIRELDQEKGRIALTYKKTSENPWEVLQKDYPVGSIVEAKIVNMTAFGAFAEILPGIDGLIHISQIANRHIKAPQEVLTIGEKVMVKILDIDFAKHRIGLSIKALEEPDENIEE